MPHLNRLVLGVLFFVVLFLPAPTLQAARIEVDDRVSIHGGPRNIRATASTTGALVGTQPTDALGTITEGPVSSGGFTWWNINFDSGVDGWTIDPYLVRILSNNTPVTSLSGWQGSGFLYRLSVPKGANNLSFATSGGSGNVDMFVRFGMPLTTSTYDQNSATSDNTESVTIAIPQEGVYYVLLRASTAYSGVTLTASYTASPVPFYPVAQYQVVTDEIIKNHQFSEGLSSWTRADTSNTVITSEIRSGGQAMRVGSSVTQSLDASSLISGRAYTFRITARNLDSSTPNWAAVRFRESRNGETYRTYKIEVSSTSYDTHEIHFTAPTYLARAEVVLRGTAANRLVIDSTSLTMREPIPQTEIISLPYAGTAPEGYGLIFNDEFNGARLDRTKWFTRYIYTNETLDRLNDEKQRYRDNDNHRISGGALHLVARKVRDNDPNGINYESGMIRSDFTTRYGYFEARVKMPGGRGVWPAFWLSSEPNESGRIIWPPEIDIFELVNNGVEDLVNMLHTGVINHPNTTSTITYRDPDFSQTWNYWKAPFDFDDDWHMIGLEWTPETVSTFVDGKRVVTRTYNWNALNNGYTAGPAHILLNLAIGGSWAGRHGIDDTAFPQALEIDWIRVYKKL